VIKAESMSDPKQPNRFEKKKNISSRLSAEHYVDDRHGAAQVSNSRARLGKASEKNCRLSIR